MDGFRAAEELREKDPFGFELLATYNVPYQFEDRASENPAFLYDKKPMIQVDGDVRRGRIKAVTFNNRSMQAVTSVPGDKMEAFYAAYMRFAEILFAEENMLTFKLLPGDCRG